MEKICTVSYKAFDGEVFDTFEECAAHEAKLERCFSEFLFYDSMTDLPIPVKTPVDFEEAYQIAVIFKIKDTPTWREDLHFIQHDLLGFPCGDFPLPGAYFNPDRMGYEWVRM